MSSPKAGKSEPLAKSASPGKSPSGRKMSAQANGNSEGKSGSAYNTPTKSFTQSPSQSKSPGKLGKSPGKSATKSPSKTKMASHQNGSAVAEVNSKGSDCEEASFAQEQFAFTSISQDEGSPRIAPIFAADASYVFVPSSSSVRIYTYPERELVSTLPAEGTIVSSLVLNPFNTQQILVGYGNGTLRVWDFVEGLSVRTLKFGVHGVVRHIAPLKAHMSLVSIVGKHKSMLFLTSLHKAPGSQEPDMCIKVTTLSEPIVDIVVSDIQSKAVVLSPSHVYGAVVENDGAQPLRIKPLVPLLKATSARFTCIAMEPRYQSNIAVGNDRGEIRLHHELLTGTPDTLRGSATAASQMHWHSSRVNTIKFTHNGAYLISGGTEGVFVLWQVFSQHREYVPRLGGPICSVDLTPANAPVDPTAALSLADGTVLFIGLDQLKLQGVPITGFKSSAHWFSRNRKGHGLLAVDHISGCIVTLAPHPSSIQFFQPLSRTLVAELEVAKSNRVPHVADRPVTPTIVTHAAISEADGSTMVTAEVWAPKDVDAESRDVVLKLWKRQSKKSTSSSALFDCVAQFPHPHGFGQTIAHIAVSFDGSKFISAATDGSIRVWGTQSAPSYLEQEDTSAAWRCLAEFSYRNMPVHAVALSKDATLFALGHTTCTTLWTAATNSLVAALPHPGTIGVGFLTNTQSLLAIVGARGASVWDVISMREVLHADFAISGAVIDPNSACLTLAVTREDEHSLNIPDGVKGSAKKEAPKQKVTSLITHDLHTHQQSTSAVPYAMRDIQRWTNAAQDPSRATAYAIMTATGDITLAGPPAVVKSEKTLAPAVLPRSSFGEKEGLFANLLSIRATNVSAPESVAAPQLNVSSVLDAPAYALPSLSSLWPSLLSDISGPLSTRTQSPPAETAESNARPKQNTEVDMRRVPFDMLSLVNDALSV